MDWEEFSRELESLKHGNSLAAFRKGTHSHSWQQGFDAAVQVVIAAFDRFVMEQESNTEIQVPKELTSNPYVKGERA